jgi:uncharacterized low-complexity protein
MKNKRKNTIASIVLGTSLMGISSFAGATGSCGAGKCGSDMNKTKSTKMKKEGMMTGKAGKSSGSCGAGKCGSM